MRPKPVIATATSTENTEIFGVNLSETLIKNQGTTDCVIDFDSAISAGSYLLEAGEVLSIAWPFTTLYYKTASGTTTLYIIKIFQ